MVRWWKRWKNWLVSWSIYSMTWPQTECCYQWKVTWHDPKQNVVINERLHDMTPNRMLLSMKDYMTWPQTECCYQWKVTWHDPKQNVVINERLHDMTPNRMLLSMKRYMTWPQTECC
jgi:hypothetical protein